MHSFAPLFYFLVLFNVLFAGAEQAQQAARVGYCFVQDVVKNDDIIYLGYVGETFGATVNGMQFYFAAKRRSTIECARLEIVKFTEKCLTYINNDFEIQSLLKKRPFTSENLEISIKYLENIDKDSDPKDFYMVWLLKGKVNYYSYDGGVYPLLSESYENSKENCN